MSYILPNQEENLRAAFTDILLLRFDILNAFSYKKLLDFDYDELTAFIATTKHTPGKPWPELRKFLALSSEEKKRFRDLIITNPDEITLPAVRLDILMRLSTLTADQKTEANQRLLRSVRDAASALDLQQLIAVIRKSASKNSDLQSAEISMSTAYEAIHSTCLRLNRMTTSMRYLTQWVLAHANSADNHELLSDPSYFSFDSSATDDGRSYSEIIGKEDADMNSLESAQTAIILVNASLEASTAFCQKSHGQFLYDLLKVEAARMTDNFKAQNYKAVQQSFELALEQIETFSQASTRAEKREFEEQVQRTASASFAR